ncbi:MAG: hypothetical protein JSW60_08775 [Thermoplasmatales archaeon]|nr:MAG: hypothetical protein JSW60_08775 [Thermoplasmatales archaeon]
MPTDETLVWIRKGIFSFIIGFIITIILGVIFAILFADVTEQFYLVVGGFPLSWLRITFGFMSYDYFAFVLDLLFWTFIVFLIATRKKKKEGFSIGEYFEDPKRKFLLEATSFSIVIALIISLITILAGVVKLGELQRGEIWEAGFPLPWLEVSSTLHEEVWIKTVVVSNWLNLIVDFILFSVLAFGIIYVVNEIRKIRRE